MRHVVFTNDKGGVGKTACCHNVAVGLARRAKRVLAIDMDPQGDLTRAILGRLPPHARPAETPPPTISTLLSEVYDFEQVIVAAPRYECLSLIASNSDLAGISLQLATQVGSQTRLRDVLMDVSRDRFDYVLIDTGKGLDLLVINAIAAAQEVVITLTPGTAELDAVGRMADHVAKVRERVNRGAAVPFVRGVILTYADRYSVTRDTVEELERRYPAIPLLGAVPKNDDVKKAFSRALSAAEFNKSSKAAQAYEQMVEEVFVQ